MTVIKVINEAGRVFNVRKVNKGDNYGLNDCLTHDRNDPLIEFHDETYKDKFGGLGQFVTRYYESTLKERSPQSKLILDMGVDVWRVSADNMNEIEARLFS